MHSIQSPSNLPRACRGIYCLAAGGAASTSSRVLMPASGQAPMLPTSSGRDWHRDQEREDSFSHSVQKAVFKNIANCVLVFVDILAASLPGLAWCHFLF